MITIIEQPEKRQIRCHKCGALLEFSKVDIQDEFEATGYKDGHTIYFIQCPIKNCNTKIKVDKDGYKRIS